MRIRRILKVSIGLWFFISISSWAQSGGEITPLCVDLKSELSQSAIMSSLYFNSKAQDAKQCRVTASNGTLSFDASVTNPAMSCPDRFAWKLFFDAVSDEFWTNWATDTLAFPGCTEGSIACDGSTAEQEPSHPLPLCADGSDPANCCDPDSKTNPGYDNEWNPAAHCPYFPADHDSPTTIHPHGRPASKAHSGRAQPDDPGSPLRTQEPDRAVRQAAAEIVYRNRPQWDYLFRNNLYNQEGLIDVFNNVNTNITGNLPYRDLDGNSGLVEIRLPIDSVSIKTNWISKEFADEHGIADEPAHIKMTIRTPARLNPMDEFGQIFFAPGEYWLVAMHISSKDIPKWTWATFEHVNNPGRCDFIGCNDSFGYDSADSNIHSGQFKNYTAPHVQNDGLCVPGYIFDLGKPYDSGTPTQEFLAAMEGMNIGTGKESDPPSPQNPAWHSYRLKGSLTNYYDEIGHARVVGNSVTEGGFVASSGCMTCHTRATIGPNGTIPPPNGIFTNDLSEFGYPKALKGRPNPMWFHRDAQPPLFEAVQTDFVWGVIFARCITPLPGQPFGCAAPP